MTTPQLESRVPSEASLAQLHHVGEVVTQSQRHSEGEGSERADVQVRSSTQSVAHSSLLLSLSHISIVRCAAVRSVDTPIALEPTRTWVWLGEMVGQREAHAAADAPSSRLRATRRTCSWN